MSPQIFADWFRKQGHKVIKTKSSYWYDAAPRIYQSFPYHEIITPTHQELQDLLKQHQGLALRYSTPLEHDTGQISYHVICQTTDYDLSKLHKKARYDVRQGLKFGNVEPISFSQLANEGWQIRMDTLDRQGRLGAETHQWWHKLCASADGLPGFEAWGLIHAHKLVASLLACQIGNVYNILYQQSLTDYLNEGINNALTYIVTEQALQHPDIQEVFYGLHSLDAPESVDNFKFRMKYEPRPVRQQVIFHPWITPVFNEWSYARVKRLNNKWCRNSTLSKAEGLIRFYLQGQLPLDEQSWPECLKGNHQLK